MSQSSHKAALQEKRRYWKDHIESWKAGQMPQARYCRRHNLKLHQFIYWRKKYSPRVEPPVSLIRVPFTGFNFHNHPSSISHPLRVLVGADRRIEVEQGFDPVVLKQLIHALERM